MKKYIIILVVLSASLTARAQWWTATSAQTGLVMCLHVTDSAVEFYSPLQTTEPLPISDWNLNGEALNINCKQIGFKISLTRSGEGWSGTWQQGIIKETVAFAPADTLYTLRRPQTPLEPYAFESEPVEVDYTDLGGNPIHLSGTLTYPRGGGRYPCVVMVSGSGQQNRDEEIFFHKPFLVLANYLAEHGIAMLRYDDRGVGSSTGPIEEATTADFAADAEAMLNALLSNSHVDTTRLGIGGHSEGGAIAPMVAARGGTAKFVIMLAGQGCTGTDVLLQQNEALFRAKGVSNKIVATRVAMMREVLALKNDAPLAQYKEVLLRYSESLTATEADTLGADKGSAYQLRKQLQSKWMQYFLTLDPATYLPAVSCPLLAINGTKDCQVVAEPNLKAIKALCPKAVTVELEGLNHLFQQCTTGGSEEYMMIEETFSEEAMNKVAEFILAL